MKASLKVEFVPITLPSCIKTTTGHYVSIQELTDAQLQVAGEEFTVNLIADAQAKRAEIAKQKKDAAEARELATQQQKAKDMAVGLRELATAIEGDLPKSSEPLSMRDSIYDTAAKSLDPCHKYIYVNAAKSVAEHVVAGQGNWGLSRVSPYLR